MNLKIPSLILKHLCAPGFLGVMRLKGYRGRLILIASTLWISAAYGQLVVTIWSPKTAGTKAVVKVELKNGFSEKVASARAAVFIMDEQGKMIGQATRWVIGDPKNKTSLSPGKEMIFNFVVPLQLPAISTNLQAKVSFNRVILEGGKSADLAKEVTVTPASN